MTNNFRTLSLERPVKKFCGVLRCKQYFPIYGRGEVRGLTATTVALRRAKCRRPPTVHCHGVSPPSPGPDARLSRPHPTTHTGDLVRSHRTPISRPAFVTIWKQLRPSVASSRDRPRLSAAQRCPHREQCRGLGSERLTAVAADPPHTALRPAHPSLALLR